MIPGEMIDKLRITFNRIGLYRLAVHRNVFIVSKPIIRQAEITR